jgi:hypothetical protein
MNKLGNNSIILGFGFFLGSTIGGAILNKFMPKHNYKLETDDKFEKYLKENRLNILEKFEDKYINKKDILEMILVEINSPLLIGKNLYKINGLLSEKCYT